ncbi:MAG: hypothetical protein H7Z19_06425, partial [Chitinophagaceae bacterium]|nr:hypothetical protein [Rubrivivax sp.]
MNRRDLLGAAALMSIGNSRAQTPGASAPTDLRYADTDLRHAEALREMGLADRQAWPLLQQLCTDVGARA